MSINNLFIKIFNKIQSDCFRDHLLYIKKCIYNERKINILETYKKDIQTYNQILIILKKVALNNPNILSVLLENSNDNSKDIQVLKHLMEYIRDNNLFKIKEDTIKIIKNMSNINNNLNKISIINDNHYNYDNDDIIISLSNNKIPLNEHHNMKINNKHLNELNKLNDELNNLIDIYLSAFINISEYVEYIKNILISTDINIIKSNFDKLCYLANIKNTINFDTDDIQIIKNNIFLLIKQLLKTNYNVNKISLFDNIYDYTIKQINNKIKYLYKYSNRLELITNNVNKCLYNDDIKDFSSIQTYILPKVRDIIDIFILYLKTNKNDILDNLCKKFIINNTNNNIYKDLKLLVSHTDPNIFNEMYKNLNIMDKINFYEETNFKLNDFIQYYNNTFNSSDGITIINELNIFMANIYKCYIAHILKPDSTYNYLDEMLNRNIKRSQKIKYFIYLINKKQPIETKSISIDSNKFYLFIRKNKLFMKQLNTEINDIESARLFINSYNKIMYQVEDNLLSSLYIPSSLRLIPYKYFDKRESNNRIKLFDYIDNDKTTLLNNIIKNIEPEYNELNLIFPKNIKICTDDLDLNNDLLDSYNDMNHKKLIIISNKKVFIDKAIKHYQKNVNNYLSLRNNVYYYTKYLILTSTNRTYTKQNIRHMYFNKDLITFYKKIIIKINEKYKFVVFIRLELFLNKLDTFLNSSDIIDVNNIDIADIRNDFELLNYFIPFIKKYDISA